MWAYLFFYALQMQKYKFILSTTAMVVVFLTLKDILVAISDCESLKPALYAAKLVSPMMGATRFLVISLTTVALDFSYVG
jgi:hypothetical protein